ncbi:MAG: DUF2892 domain-containing protein [Actinomycetota bacterium]|jgi:hypothetical protein|nr:DUF2892 domain-containing protein [Actinomycetota bacterium]
MALVRFMERPIGRVTRGVLGLVLIGIGAGLGSAWWILAAVGLVPLAAGVFNFCLAAPLFHAPMRHAHPTV